MKYENKVAITVGFRTKIAIVLFYNSHPMAIREYFVLGAVGILSVFSLAIWLEKMMKIILGNYLLTALCLALSPTITVLTGRVTVQAPDVQQSIWFLFTNTTIIILVVYLLMLILIFVRSRIHIGMNLSGPAKIAMLILAIPMTILSIILTLEIAVLWLQAFDMIALKVLASSMPVAMVYKQFVMYTPVIIAIHAVITVLMLSNISFLPKKWWWFVGVEE